jgi:hypothetical protein
MYKFQRHIGDHIHRNKQILVRAFPCARYFYWRLAHKGQTSNTGSEKNPRLQGNEDARTQGNHLPGNHKLRSTMCFDTITDF